MRRLSRRSALGTATAAALAPSVALAKSQSDARDHQLLEELVRLETESARIYAIGAREKTLSARLRELLGEMAKQEQAHVDALNAALKRNPSKAGSRMKAPEGRAAVLRRASAQEQRLLSAAESATRQLSKASLAALVASTMANDAQHLALLRLELGKDPLPSAFVPPR
ncbi:MAG: ferritin-like domain-containing protein [Thermoleophilaceae bacterium]